MVSKGVDYYSFIAVNGTVVVFAGPDAGSTTTSSNNFTKNHLEIESGSLPFLVFTGVFSWNVMQNGVSIYSRSQAISTLTGNLEDGHLWEIMNTPAVIEHDYTISYGLYDAGSGVAGLPNADQAWVSIVPNLSDWMGQLAPPNSKQASQPFAQFVLAAAHDAGMNTMDGINIITSSAEILGFIIGVAGALIPIPELALLLGKSPQKIMLDLAITQKESITAMLYMGVRYFDFRPAYLLQDVRPLVKPGADTLYHIHLVVPGQRFDSFLAEVVAFLRAFPTEFAVIRTCSDGIKYCEIPSATVITQFVQDALNGTGIQLGDSSCFQRSIAELRTSNTRLILVQNNAKYDSYTDEDYAQLDPTKILGRFAQMETSGQAGNDFTVLQCQGTDTSIKGVLVYAATAANWSTSPLMATKASFDIQTLPWILANALNNLQAKQNIIIMNDFIDGATTYTAYQLSSSRFAQHQVALADTILTSAAVENAIGTTQGEKAQAEALKAKEEAALAAETVNVALLQTITASHQSTLAAKGAAVSEEDRQVQAILEATRQEAEDARRNQQELANLAERRLQEAEGV